MTVRRFWSEAAQDLMISLRQDASFRAVENWLKLHSFRPVPPAEPAVDALDFAPAAPPAGPAAANPSQDDAAPQADLDEPTGQLLFGPIKSYNYFAAPIGPDGPYSQASGFDGPGLLDSLRQGAAGPRGDLAASAFEHDLEGLFGSDRFAAGESGLLTADFGSLGSHAFLMVDGNGQAGYQSEGDFVFHIGELMPMAPPVI